MDEPDGFPSFEDEQPRGRLRRGTTTIVGGALAALAVGSFLFYSDRNSDHFVIRCSRGVAEARRGIFLPWGTSSIDDEAHGDLALPDGVPCVEAHYTELAELDRAYGALALEAAERRLTFGGPEGITQAREELERATRLQGLDEDQRARAEALLADTVYHEAREILRQVERDLWQARRKLERARSLGAAARLGDLDEWLEFVETETERFRPALAGGAGASGEEQGEAPEVEPPPTPSGPPPTSSSDVFL